MTFNEVLAISGSLIWRLSFSMGITVSTPPKLYAKEYAFGETWRLEARDLEEGESAIIIDL